MNRQSRLIVPIVAAVAIAVTGIVPAAGRASQTPGARPSSDDMDQAHAAIDALLPSFSADRYEVEAKARVLGPGITNAFTFVRDQVRYEAYSGVLRGASGTLAAMAGNAYDRALLLGQLLRVNDIPVRYANCALGAAESARAFARMFDGFSQPRGEADASPFMTRVLARAARDYPIIRGAVGTSLRASGDARDQALRDITRHVWVQAEVDDKWIDLDPTFANSSPGVAYCAAAETVDEVPTEWHQRVTVRVVTERLEDGELTTTSVLNSTLVASSLLEAEVFLLHVPSGRTDPMAIGARAAAASGEPWTPVLIVGGQATVGDPVDFADTDGAANAADPLGGGSSSIFVSESIEFEVERPDGRTDSWRRQLVDRASPAWRAAPKHAPSGLTALAKSDDGPFAPRAVHNILFSAGPRNLRRFLQLVDLSAAGPDPGTEPELAEQLLPIAVHNQSTLLWSDHVTITRLNDLASLRVYSDTPRISIVSLSQTPNGIREEFDLRRDVIVAVARDRATDSAALDRQIRYAVMQGALEHEFIARNGEINGLDSGKTVSTSALLRTNEVITLRAANRGRLRELTRNADTAVRLDDAIAASALVVVPRSVLDGTGPIGWWEIAEHGQTRPVLHGSLHGSWLDGPYTPGQLAAQRSAQRAANQQYRRNLAQLRQILWGQQRPAGDEYSLLTGMVVVTAIKSGTILLTYGMMHLAKKTTTQLECLRAGCR